MGATIHYSLRLAAAQTSRIGQILERVAQAARTLGFQEVEAPLHFEGAACSVDHETDPGKGWLLIQAQRYPTPDTKEIPEEIFVLCTVPGEGCEPANVGFSRFAGSPDWSWSSFCKTQFAAESAAGGIENFMRSHTGLCALLREIQAMGVDVEVTDDTGFWSHGDRAALARHVQDAQAAAQLLDRLLTGRH